MHLHRWFAALVVLVTLAAWDARAWGADDPAWTTPIAPFRIADNLYYVGSRDLASYLVTTPAGNILINSNLASSPPSIRHSVEQLGFRWRDTRILLISHAHVDHAGGSAETVKETGAKFEVMQGDVDVAESGGKTDFAFGPRPQFPPVHVDHTFQDGDEVRLGGVTLTAHRTAGHTRGCTTWTLKVHLPGDPAGKLRDVVIVGSWSVLSSYRLVSLHGKPPSYPGIAADYKRAFSVLHALPCDLFLASHGTYFGMLDKLKRMPAEGARVWIDPDGYLRAVDGAQQAFERVYAQQTAEAAKGEGRR